MQLKHTIKSKQELCKVSSPLLSVRCGLIHGAARRQVSATRLDLLTVSCD